MYIKVINACRHLEMDSYAIIMFTIDLPIFIKLCNGIYKINMNKTLFIRPSRTGQLLHTHGGRDSV